MDRPDILPAVIPLVSVALPCCAVPHWTGPGLVELSVWLIGYPSPGVDVRTSAGEPLLNADVAAVDAAVVAGVVVVCNQQLSPHGRVERSINAHLGRSGTRHGGRRCTCGRRCGRLVFIRVFLELANKGTKSVHKEQ